MLILSSLCGHYISPFSSGDSALRNDWMEGSALGELMPSSRQLVDLDRLHHVPPVPSGVRRPAYPVIFEKASRLETQIFGKGNICQQSLETSE